ncbi:hypothetical protein DFP72DRAFT_885485 [Ephemerocybe angulata]|uniref:Uncharacterized protein n=1 Tax=Ephemerocybe angulata TaxID=980116 RepID=A0A8H6I851_9AGAR|nr:hypothetical protein DFP72DRAFT_885485 [Tulosesus angulatus]
MTKIIALPPPPAPTLILSPLKEALIESSLVEDVEMEDDAATDAELSQPPPLTSGQKAAATRAANRKAAKEAAALLVDADPKDSTTSNDNGVAAKPAPRPLKKAGEGSTLNLDAPPFTPTVVVRIAPADPNGFIAMCGLSRFEAGMTVDEDRARLASNEVKIAEHLASIIPRINSIQNDVIPKASNASSHRIAALEGRVSGFVTKTDENLASIRDDIGLMKDKARLMEVWIDELKVKVENAQEEMEAFQSSKNTEGTGINQRLNTLSTSIDTIRATQAASSHTTSPASLAPLSLIPNPAALSYNSHPHSPPVVPPSNHRGSSPSSGPSRNPPVSSSNRFEPYNKSDHVCVWYGIHRGFTKGMDNPITATRQLVEMLDISPKLRGSDVHSSWRSKEDSSAFLITFYKWAYARDFVQEINRLSSLNAAPYPGVSARIV